MKICFYCDTLFSIGGVRRVLSAIDKAFSIRYEISIRTLDDPAKEGIHAYLDNAIVLIHTKALST
ncbi:MAG: hypothetical protein RR382_12835 [Tannerellaceae bacterium]